ncbi:MAG: hypothetical protein KBT78_03140 [Marinobacter psychrophilus]|nr:hypothetical protein [Marinobacter psychrophilus]MBQ0843814.1 hypothetical protein [Marinobacter psychrophilus]
MSWPSNLLECGLNVRNSIKKLCSASVPNTHKTWEALIHASEVIAVHFQTVAAANNYWK